MSTRDTALQSVAEQDATRQLFGQTMGLVGVTAAFFAGGAYLGRDMSSSAGLLWFLSAFGALFGIRMAIARSPSTCRCWIYINSPLKTTIAASYRARLTLALSASGTKSSSSPPTRSL